MHNHLLFPNTGAYVDSGFLPPRCLLPKLWGPLQYVHMVCVGGEML